MPAPRLRATHTGCGAFPPMRRHRRRASGGIPPLTHNGPKLQAAAPRERRCPSGAACSSRLMRVSSARAEVPRSRCRMTSRRPEDSEERPARCLDAAVGSGRGTRSRWSIEGAAPGRAAQVSEPGEPEVRARPLVEAERSGGWAVCGPGGAEKHSLVARRCQPLRKSRRPGGSKVPVCGGIGRLLQHHVQEWLPGAVAIGLTTPVAS